MNKDDMMHFKKSTLREEVVSTYSHPHFPGVLPVAPFTNME